MLYLFNNQQGGTLAAHGLLPPFNYFRMYQEHYIAPRGAAAWSSRVGRPSGTWSLNKRRVKFTEAEQRRLAQGGWVIKPFINAYDWGWWLFLALGLWMFIAVPDVARLIGPRWTVSIGLLGLAITTACLDMVLAGFAVGWTVTKWAPLLRMWLIWLIGHIALAFWFAPHLWGWKLGDIFIVLLLSCVGAGPLIALSAIHKASEEWWERQTEGGTA